MHHGIAGRLVHRPFRPQDDALLVLYAGFAVGTLLLRLRPNYALLVLGRIVAGGFGGVVNAVVLTIVGDLFHDSGAAGRWAS